MDEQFAEQFAAKYADAPLQGKHIGVLIKGIATALKPVFAAYEARIASLEERVAAQKDRGIWAAGEVYRAGNLVTHANSGWICNETHVSVGTGPDHQKFRLFVRAGRDARDRR